MTRADIAARIHQQTDISTVEAEKLLDHILEFIKSTLQSGESIMIAGFGKFTVRSKRARPGRNPRTGEAIEVSACRVVSFQSSLLFKRAINSPTVTFKRFIIRPAPRPLAGVDRWSLNLHISWSTKYGTYIRHFFTADKYATEEEATTNSIAYGQLIIDGKIPGLSVG